MELEVKVPSVGESITEVTIANWLKNDGEEVDMDEVICEIESDKATFELSAESAGILHIKVGEGETVDVGSVIASINTAGATTEATKPMATTSPETEAKPASQEKPASKSSDKDHYASGTPSPAAQKILSEKDISPESVSGTGRDGRITKEDAMKAEASKATPTKEAATPSKPTTPAPASTMTGKRETRSERMSSLRRTIARRLVEVKNTTAMLTTFNEVDMTAIMEIRKKYKESFKEKHGIGLGFMSFFTKAVTEAMKDFPDINAKIDGDEIVYHDYADIGIAVSTPRGLVVPVIRNADSLSLAGIEKEVMNLALKARDNKISIEEMQGGTFTITNGGVFGSLLSTPIINSPQSAILGMHNIVERPMAINGQVVIRPMMYVALSYDHRIVDGKESVGFLVKVKQMLEDPNRLLLEV